MTENKAETGIQVVAGVVAAEAEKANVADGVAAEAEKATDTDGVAAGATAGTDLAKCTGVPAVRGGTADTDAVGAENVRIDTGAVEAEAERGVAEVPGKEATAQITEMIAQKNTAAVKIPATRRESKAQRMM